MLLSSALLCNCFVFNFIQFVILSGEKGLKCTARFSKSLIHTRSDNFKVLDGFSNILAEINSPFGGMNSSNFKHGGNLSSNSLVSSFDM